MISGYQFFKVFDEHQLEYILLAKGGSDDVYMVGKLAAFQIQNLLVAYKERFDKDNFIKKMDDEKFFELAKPYLEAAIKKPLDLKKIAGMVKTRIETLCDIADQVDFFEEMPEYSADMYIHKKMKTTKENSLETLKEVLPILEAQDDFSNDALFEALSKYVADKGVKTGFVMWPIRTAVSGKQMTPAGATEIMEIIGKEESLTRIRKGIELLEAAE